MSERNPWQWTECQHWHQRDTNGDMYRCPLDGCWWNVQRREEQDCG